MKKHQKFMRGLRQRTGDFFRQGVGAIVVAMLMLGGGPGYAWANRDQQDLTQLSVPLIGVVISLIEI